MHRTGSSILHTSQAKDAERGNDKKMNPWSWLAIAIGGGLGATARFLLTRGKGRWLGQNLPYGTLTVNAVGSWMLGFLAVFLLDRVEVSPVLRLGVTVGFLGAFTTFSTFSYETITLLQQESSWKALTNIGANLFFCLGLCYLGMQMARW